MSIGTVLLVSLALSFGSALLALLVSFVKYERMTDTDHLMARAIANANHNRKHQP